MKRPACRWTGSMFSWAIPACRRGRCRVGRGLLQLATATAGSPHLNLDPAKLELTSGWVHGANQPYKSGIPFEEVVRLARLSGIMGEGRTTPTFEDPKAKDLSL